MSKAKISLCMIVKDEADFIEQAIGTAKPFIHEIIIVDTGSSDQTPELAESLGAKVFRKSWNNDFSEVRNFSIKQATHPFILVMDADEIISNASTESLSKLCEQLRESPGSAGVVTILNETMSGDVSSTTVVRIFPKDDRYQFKGKIHEQLTFMGGSIQENIDSGVMVKHYGYTQSQITKKNKYERNLSLLIKELNSQSDTSYIQYQIGRTYYIMKEYVQAEHFLNECVEAELKGSRRNFMSSALLTLGYCYIHSRKFDNLLECYQLAIDLFPDYTDLYFMYGVGLIESRAIDAFREIPVIFRKCIELGEASSVKYETVRGVGSFKAHFNLALFYELTGQLEKAVHHYQLSGRNGYSQAQERLHHLLR
ncbi:glycosyltransferase [Paenibacillus cisolokensis]|uniref:tetratricopeptide repeat-containing glycosyltransferase family 2 protein n=1 Tax=Paenibacillus cisolokensis TaxID=1658519 RepID=UPI003D281EB6